MNDELTLILAEIGLKTFEDLCFMLPGFDTEDVPETNRMHSASVVSFEGPASGKLIIRVCPNLLVAIAANMLGEENPSEHHQYDALGEIANVVCGNALPRITGSKDVFHLHSPRRFEMNELIELEGRNDVLEAMVALDEGTASILMSLNDNN